VLEDTTTVIVMGCVSCAAKPYDMLDSLLLSCAKQQCRMILIMTPVDPNIDNVIIAKIRLANSIHIITDTEDGIKNSGLYHKSPKLFIVTKEGEVLKKVVIK